jgi:hypothetical protein
MASVDEVERAEDLDELLTIGELSEERRGHETVDVRGEAIQLPMLCLERVDEVHQDASTSQAGKDKGFLDLLVILLREAVNDPSGALDDVG